MSLNPESLVGFIEGLAAETGKALRGMVQHPDLSFEYKSDGSIVTDADRYAESVLRDRIKARFPDHGIVGEEFGNESVDAEYVWVLDPIDGTLSFVSGVPLFGTQIALTRGGEPILGAINLPMTGELVVGTPSGTVHNGRPVRVRQDVPLEKATLLTTDPSAIGRYWTGAAFDELRKRTALYRTWGDCYGYVLVASGRADIMTDPIMNPWDIAALVPVIRGAGGVITTWEGDDPTGGTSTIAAAPRLHAEALRILNEES